MSNEIIPSDKTSNKIFKGATQFEMDAAKGDFAALAAESNYQVRNVASVAELDENLPGLPEQRNIVQWAFNDDTEEGEIKRFNLSYGGYAIVQLVEKKAAGLASAKDVFNEVAPKVREEKKAKMIIEDNKSIASLEDLAAKNGLEVVNALAINQKSGTLVGAGYEPYVVGAAFGLAENGLSKLIKGNNGVYKLQLTAKRVAEDLEDYTAYAQQLQKTERDQLAQRIIVALESAAKIEDNRALYY